MLGARQAGNQRRHLNRSRRRLMRPGGFEPPTRGLEVRVGESSVAAASRTVGLSASVSDSSSVGLGGARQVLELRGHAVQSLDGFLQPLLERTRLLAQRLPALPRGFLDFPGQCPLRLRVWHAVGRLRLRSPQRESAPPLDAGWARSRVKPGRRCRPVGGLRLPTRFGIRASLPYDRSASSTWIRG